WPVSLLEEPPANQWNPHRRKIAGAGGAIVGVARPFARRQRIKLFNEFLHRFGRFAAVLFEESAVRSVATHRQRARGADVCHARQRLETFEQPMMKLRERTHFG